MSELRDLVKGAYMFTSFILFFCLTLSAFPFPPFTNINTNKQYYLDVQNVRATYVSQFLDKLINWDFVNSNVKA